MDMINAMRVSNNQAWLHYCELQAQWWEEKQERSNGIVE